MAIVKAVSSKASIKTAIEYVTKDEKTEDKLVSGINCTPEYALEEMQATKELWNKTDGRTYKHFVQSYHPEDPITPEQAHKNALELAEKTKAFEGFEVLVATHVDKDHIHSHIIVNSVNMEDGHKLQWNKHDLAQMKELSNEQSKKQGLHISEKGKTFKGEKRKETSAYTKEAYQQLKKAEAGELQSYIQDIALKVLQARETAQNKEDFIKSLEQVGIGVDWQDNHKYITFTDKDREAQGEKKCKIRNNKLENYYNIDLTKEGLENEFDRNKRTAESRDNTIKETAEIVTITESAVEETKRNASADTERGASEQRINARRIERMEETSRASQKHTNTFTRRYGADEKTTELSGSGKSAIDKTSRIIDQSAAAIDRSIRTMSEIIQPEQGEGEQNNAAIEYEIKLLRELNTEISRTSKEFEYCKKEQSDINRQSNGIRDGLKELKERIRDLGEAHRGIKERITDCFRKQSDIGERIEQAINQTIDRVFRRGGR